jgi:hypothetical protein
MNGRFAYYEAGHAVVGHVLGFVVESASIIESGGVGGEVAFAENPPDPGADERCYLDYRERELVFTLGGPLAQGLYLEGDTAATTQLFGQHAPRDAAFKDEDDAGKRYPVWHLGPSTSWSRRLRRQ